LPSVYFSGEGLLLINLYSKLGNFLYPDSYLVPDFIAYSYLGFIGISVHELEANKVHVYRSDKTLAYTFDSVEQAARELTPSRCSYLSEVEIGQKKNIRYLRRVINKNVLTMTEKGQFYIFQKPNHSSCLALVP
jgi:hypothetical protein